VAAAHVFKFSQQRLPGLADDWPLSEPLLVIETHGGDGLRYRDQRPGAAAGWRHLPALPAPAVRDAGGCGDWCTAGLIHGVGQEGRAGLAQAPAEQVREGLRFGQALAAWNCAFEGARGAVFTVDRATFVSAVERVLAGQPVEVPPAAPPPVAEEGRAHFCPACRRLAR
jgi:fructokinase